MAHKRFTDIDIWNDPWWRKLSIEGKVFWKYIVDQCDIAGFWKKDYELASFNCGFTMTDKIVEEINTGKKRIHDHNDYLEVVQFIEFQQKTTKLNPNNKAHLGILNLLSKYRSIKGFSPIQKISTKAPSKELLSSTGKGIGNSIGKGNKKKGSGEKESIFEKFWALFPKKVGKGFARKAWDKINPDDKLFERIKIAIALQEKSEQWQKDGGQFIPNPATWLNQERWEDEVTKIKNTVVDLTEK